MNQPEKTQFEERRQELMQFFSEFFAQSHLIERNDYIYEGKGITINSGAALDLAIAETSWDKVKEAINYQVLNLARHLQQGRPQVLNVLH